MNWIRSNTVDYQWNITIQVIVLIILKLKLKLLHTVFSRPCITCAICYTCILIYLRTEKKIPLPLSIVQFDSYYLGMEKTHIYSYGLLVSCPMSKIYK